MRVVNSAGNLKLQNLTLVGYLVGERGDRLPNVSSGDGHLERLGRGVVGGERGV